MLIYHYRPETGEITGSSPAQLDPGEQLLGREIYMIPAFATDKKPPILGTNESAVWNGSEWAVAEDYRGQTHYDPKTGRELTISELGVKPDVTTPPPGDFRSPRWDGKVWVDDNPLTVSELREKAYQDDGLTTQALVVALWEKLVENRPEAAEEIQAKRLAIKGRIPK